jgi:hypothetical protein
MAGPRPGGASLNVSAPIMVGVLVALATAGGGAAWAMRMRALDEQIATTTKGLKTLHLGGKLPPNQDVMDYLTARGAALDTGYRDALSLLTTPPVSLKGHADPQLYFQQRVHEVQSQLVRLSSARGLTPPTLLGLPKELPPSDVAPRFLLQLALIEQLAETVLPIADVDTVASFKVEDPGMVPAGDEEPFITRLPVRLRGSASLKGVSTMLAAIDRMRPVVDVSALRVSVPKVKTDAGDAPSSKAGAAPSTAGEAPSPRASGVLEIDCVLVRYVAGTAPLPEPKAVERNAKGKAR